MQNQHISFTINKPKNESTGFMHDNKRQHINVFGIDDDENEPDSKKQKTQIDYEKLCDQEELVALKLVEDGKLSQALNHFNTCLEYANNILGEKGNELRGKYYEYKAQILMELGSYFDAVQQAHQATECRPNWPFAFLTLGRAQLNFGELSLALDSLRKARALAVSQKNSILENEIVEDIKYVKKNLMEEQKMRQSLDQNKDIQRGRIIECGKIQEIRNQKKSPF